MPEALISVAFLGHSFERKRTIHTVESKSLKIANQIKSISDLFRWLNKKDVQYCICLYLKVWLWGSEICIPPKNTTLIWVFLTELGTLQYCNFLFCANLNPGFEAKFRIKRWLLTLVWFWWSFCLFVFRLNLIICFIQCEVKAHIRSEQLLFQSCKRDKPINQRNKKQMADTPSSSFRLYCLHL